MAVTSQWQRPTTARNYSTVLNCVGAAAVLSVVDIILPESPFLYNMSVQYGTDAVSSYFGMRDVWVGRDANGTARPCLSGRYVRARRSLARHRQLYCQAGHQVWRLT
jgi:hypothetical protein